MKKHFYLMSLIFIGALSANAQTKGLSFNLNPLIEEWKTPFGLPPFDKIKPEHFIPAFNQGMEENKNAIDAIISNSEIPTFKNTIEAIENSSELLTKVSSVFYNLLSSNTNPEMQAIAKEMAPKLSKHNDDINLNPKLFEKIKYVYNSRNVEKLSSEQLRLLEKYYSDFIRSGANLNENDKARLREINSALSIATLKFGDNILAETNKFQLIIKEYNQLQGLPTSLIEAATEQAKISKIDGVYIFTLHKPSYIPFLQYAKNRDLRQRIYSAFKNRCNNNNEFDNKELIVKIVNLRQQKAKILGYKNHASFVLENNMAKNPESVLELLKKLWEPSLNIATKELNELQTIAKKDGFAGKIEPFDWWYYTEKLRKEKYNLDEEQLRPYFKLENVRDGIFEVTNKLYGIKFVENKTVPLPHPEAMFYEVKEANGNLLGVLYMDFFPRPSKKSGAWCSTLRTAHYENGKRIIPISSITCNFSKPTADKPALLNLDEVETFFHEFGHAIHGLVSNCQYRGSVSVSRDFVELPSQIMENWATEPQVLKMYAKHYKTKAVIPDSLIKKMQLSSHFNQGFATVEYLSAAFLDMSYHTISSEEKINVENFELSTLNNLKYLSAIDPRYKSTYFQHIFAGGYSSGYYSYIWAEVLDADAFGAFKEKGNLFDKTIANSFRKNILENGNSIEPMTMYQKFRGRTPSIEPLLIKRGLK